MTREFNSRRKIIEVLKREGAADAATLGDALGISAMAARQHLYSLVEEGLVTATSSPKGVGRPIKRWQLTAAADDFFPQGYAELTVDILNTLREAFGESGMDRVIALRNRDQQKAYHSQIDGLVDLSARLDRLAEIRTKEGYMAKVENDGDDYLFIENHCPICAAAKACTGLCAAELKLFRSVLGNNVDIERTDHIIHGARRCAYRISLRKAA